MEIFHFFGNFPLVMMWHWNCVYFCQNPTNSKILTTIGVILFFLTWIIEHELEAGSICYSVSLSYASLIVHLRLGFDQKHRSDVLHRTVLRCKFCKIPTCSIEYSFSLSSSWTTPKPGSSGAWTSSISKNSRPTGRPSMCTWTLCQQISHAPSRIRGIYAKHESDAKPIDREARRESKMCTAPGYDQ